MLEMLYRRFALAYFVVATLLLMLFAALMFVAAVWEAVELVLGGKFEEAALDGTGILIIGFAVVETAKFIAEEEVVRKRELRSSTKSRRSLTKFITIIVIALSLEALVMVFKTSQKGVDLAVYPAFLFLAAMFALLALGGYQWLSSRIDLKAESQRKRGKAPPGEPAPTPD